MIIRILFFFHLPKFGSLTPTFWDRTVLVSLLSLFFEFGILNRIDGLYIEKFQKFLISRHPKIFFDQIFAECSPEYHFHLPKFGALTPPTFWDRADLGPFFWGPFLNQKFYIEVPKALQNDTKWLKTLENILNIFFWTILGAFGWL